ncbi:hypothetical protein PSAB6_190074 [Paraburkholderia sabiae]|nr:hypothetical protein PSAB6_190074 [Paraburkholderia sabiae]
MCRTEWTKNRQRHLKNGSGTHCQTMHNFDMG